ncbi:MAG: fumarylacetoacetate hydrolase family protein [Anaerolineae bacterium]|jgi:2-dehydro-3-deoxy-D-arabinonate dehydratase|nr:fumarylacetoacetate hydrolase [Chloroflexota bacterium]
MLPDRSLCRFRLGDQPAHLGYIRQGQLVDLTASGDPQYASLGDWLLAASGRAAAASAALEGAAAACQPLGAVEALLEQGLTLLAPIDRQEVWACGVTYEMSRSARMRESREPTIYEKVYDAERPEIFFKATPQRVVGPGEAVGIRADSTWDVPEAELTLLVTPALEIVGYTVGNDMSSRSIEGENPLYLPQAKVYDRCCALGPVVVLAEAVDPLNLPITCRIEREGATVFSGETHTRLIHRPLAELIHYLGRCNTFAAGVLVMTGTGVVPPDTFTLREGDTISLTIGQLGTLTNPVTVLPIG